MNELIMDSSFINKTFAISSILLILSMFLFFLEINKSSTKDNNIDLSLIDYIFNFLFSIAFGIIFGAILCQFVIDIFVFYKEDFSLSSMTSIFIFIIASLTVFVLSKIFCIFEKKYSITYIINNELLKNKKLNNELSNTKKSKDKKLNKLKNKFDFILNSKISNKNKIKKLKKILKD